MNGWFQVCTLADDRSAKPAQLRPRPVRNLCCISLNFPPSSIASVHRARHLAKYLPDYGWQPTIICADERDLDETPDWRLHELVPKDALVHKVRGIPLSLTRVFGITDLGLRTFWSLRKELTKLAQETHFDAIFITGWPFYQMLLSRRLKSLFRAPLVLDFQDPWISAWGSAQSVFSKAGVAHHLATALEPRAVRNADFVTSVSEVQNAEMAARYPWLDANRMAAIPIGGDPDDFSVLRDSPLGDFEYQLDPGCMHLSYVGTLLPRAGGLLRVLFRAFAQFRRNKPALAARVRLNFVGTSNQANDTGTFRVLPIAEAEGVGDAVREVPRRLPYLDALSVLARSDGVLLIGSDEPHYTASKIYPGLMSGRPFLSLFHPASSAHSVLSAAGGGYAFAYEGDKHAPELEEAMADALATMVGLNRSLKGANPSASLPFEARSIAGTFAAIFDRLASEKLL